MTRWRLVLLAALPVALAGAAGAGTWVWVDDEGITHITDDATRVPEAARAADDDPEAVRDLWNEAGVGPVAPASELAVDPPDARSRRLIAGAVADMGRGEAARATVALESVLRDEPGNAEAHWYLALLDRERGRYESAEIHLRAFLAAAGDDYEPWRDSAEKRLAALADERRLADETIWRDPDDRLAHASDHFRVSYDAELARGRPDYAQMVLGYLEAARESAAARLGAVPVEPMGVVFYGKAAYLQAYRHRFSFQTVGFFDGRIHVVSAAHPEGELRALLFHEYSHAVYREQTGGDTPYWLNEGLAELSERESKGLPPLTRSERASLRARIDGGRWLPLRRLAPSFSGLDDDDARAAYLEAMAAADWIERNTSAAQRARLLSRLGHGVSADGALREAVALDTDGVDAALRGDILEQFPASDAQQAGMAITTGR